MSKNWKRNSLFILFCFLTLFVSTCGTKGEKYESHSVKINDTFKIQVNAYFERSQFLVGGLYEFQVSRNETWLDKTIFTFRHDDPNPIPKNQIVVENERFAYVWIGWKFAVTTNGGTTWSIWNAHDMIGLDINYGLIEAVNIDTCGVGQMLLNDLAKKRSGIEKLVTTDFGKTWQKP